MNERLNRAKEILRSGDHTLAVLLGNEVYTSNKRGVRPLLDLYEEHGTLSGASAADKVVGKAAAILYVILGIADLYTDVISESALEVLKDHGIRVEFSTKTAAIRNRRGDGFCPMETAVRDIDDPSEALDAIYDTLKRLATASSDG